VPVPGEQGVITELQKIPKYVVTGNSGVAGKLLIEPRMPIVESESIRWYEPGDDTCLAYIGQDQQREVAIYCNILVLRKSVQPSYLKLST
jgi:hypothetical protein